MSVKGVDPEREKLLRYLKKVALDRDDTRARLREYKYRAREPAAIRRR